METQAATTGIATIKPKRKYTRRKPKIALVKPTKPVVKKELPKTARAYLRTLGMVADKEGTAIKELIKMHNALNNDRTRFEVSDEKWLAFQAALDQPVKAKPPTLWQRWFGK
jgi:hypothetical protein